MRKIRTPFNKTGQKVSAGWAKVHPKEVIWKDVPRAVKKKKKH